MPLIASGLALVQAALATLGNGSGPLWWQCDPLIWLCVAGIIVLAVGNAALCVMLGLVYVPRLPAAHTATLALACGSWLIQALLSVAALVWFLYVLVADPRFAGQTVLPTAVLGCFAGFLLMVQVRLIRAYRRYGGQPGVRRAGG